MHVSVMERSPVKTEPGLFGRRMTWITFYVDFLENYIVGFDKNATECR